MHNRAYAARKNAAEGDSAQAWEGDGSEGFAKQTRASLGAAVWSQLGDQSLVCSPCHQSFNWQLAPVTFHGEYTPAVLSLYWVASPPKNDHFDDG